MNVSDNVGWTLQRRHLSKVVKKKGGRVMYIIGEADKTDYFKTLRAHKQRPVTQVSTDNSSGQCNLLV